MSLVKRVIAALLLTGAAALLLASSTLALERVGVVTNVEGVATVARVALPEPRPLRFKDDLFLRDRITTGERSIVRVLLGGKATVTARERSVLTITEVPGVATINLGAGRVAVAVARGLMKPGEVIEIKTPNAVTAIRGTVVIAEVQPAAGGYESTITILRGLVDVTRLDPTGALTGPAVKVGALERVSVIGAQPVTAPQKITREAASRLASDFSLVPKNAPAASTEALNAEVKEISLRDARQLMGVTSPSPTSSPSGPSAGDRGVTGAVGAVVGGVTTAATGATSGLSTVTGGVTNTLNGVTGGATGALGAVTGGATGALGALTGGATGALGAVTGG
ncbi:MAG: FecR domain-containing protein, partial [Candidatus Rokuibacteriota bacterium]